MSAALYKAFRIKLKGWKGNKQSQVSPSLVPFTKDEAFVFERQATQDKRKVAASKIKQNEDTKAMQFRLKSVLLQKFNQKFKNIAKGALEKLIVEFIASKAKITAEDLIEFEVHLSTMNAPPPGEQQSSSSAAVRPSSKSANAAAASSNVGVQGSNGPETHTDLTASIPKGTEWMAINLYKTIEGDDAKRAKDEKTRQKQIEFKKTLDAQVLAMKKSKQDERLSDREYMQFVLSDLDRHNKEKEAKAAREHERHEQERRMWEAQIASERQRRMDQKQEVTEEEQRRLAVIKEEMARDKARQQAKRDEEFRKHEAILRENEATKVLRQQQRERDLIEDAATMQLYAKRLDDEARKREEAFNARVENLAKFAKWADEGPAGKGVREENLRQEKQMLLEQRQKEEREKKREVDEARLRKERNVAMLRENKAKIERQRAIQESEKQKEIERAELFRQQNEEYRSEIAATRRKEVSKQKEYNSILDRQTASKKDALDEMSERERKLNADLLKAATQPEVYARIQHRMRINSEFAEIRDPDSKKSAWA